MPSETPRKVSVVFYRTAAGREVVRDWLKALDEPARQAIGQQLMRAQFRWPIGMPLCRHLGNGLWEVRCDLPGGRIARLLFFIQSERMVIVHGFIKKTRQTPAADLALARRRGCEFEPDGEGRW